MDLKKEKLQSLLQINKEKLIFLFCSGLLLFILSLPTEKNDSQEKEKEEFLVQEVSASAIHTYEEEIELRVRKILNQVEGVGEVDVMVSLKPKENSSMFEDDDTKEVLGIIVSADGGGSAVVKAEISEAMEALFGLPSHKIKVLKRVKKESEV